MREKLKKLITAWLLKTTEKIDGKRFKKKELIDSLNVILSANGTSFSDLVRGASSKAEEEGDIASSLADKAGAIRKDAEEEFSRILQEAQAVRTAKIKEADGIARDARKAADNKTTLDSAIDFFSK